MSSVRSYSHRVNERSLELRSVDKHKFFLDRNLLSHMFHNFPAFVEMGGLIGVSYALRTDTKSGLRADEKPYFARRSELYDTNTYPLPPVRPMLEHIREAFTDGMLKILVLAGVISIAANSVKHPTDGWIEGFAILVCVFVVAIVGAYNNHKQEVSYRELASSLKGSRVNCIRAGIEVSLDQDALLVGDIATLNPGTMIPADGIMIDQTEVRVNESSITGESDERAKNFRDPFLSAGTELVDGSCSMVVTAVGINSAKGKIMASLARTQEFTQLQKRLAKAESLAAYIGFVCGTGTFLALLISFVVGSPNYSEEWNRIVDIFIISVTVVIVAIPEGLPLAVTVSMAYSMAKMRADQNLVKVLSACETMGNATAICSDKTGTLTQNRMKVVQAYVGGSFFGRQPRAEEVSAPLHALLVDSVVLNSDRRVPEDKMDMKVPPEDWKWEGDGGATEAALLSWLSRYHEPPAINIMQVRAREAERVMQFYPFSSAKKFSSVVLANPDSDGAPPAVARQYYKGAADRIIAKCSSMIAPDGSAVSIAPRDSALSPAASQAASPAHSPPPPALLPAGSVGAASTPRARAASSVGERPGSSSSRKCECVKSGEACDRWAVLGYATGPRAGVPSYCTDPTHWPKHLTTVQDAGDSAEGFGGELVLLDQNPMHIMDNMTKLGLRCIAFAYVDGVRLEMKDGQLADSDSGGEWKLIGLVGIKDPLRLETRGAVMTVQQAGIVVRMVTGDNIDTARFIAKDCGIITHPRHRAVEGAEFRAMLEAQEAHKQKHDTNLPSFVDLVKNLRVMARCQPEDKLELVKFLKEQGEIVSVTGDGSNDGPALKTANVGLAMGIAGTDVAKAAAHIIILDDNFSSIVRSVMWGRSVFDNIRKFLQFQCSVNFCALVVALVGAIGGGKEPLKPIQLLWVNLVMDTMGALAIGTEVPKPALLLRRPYRPDSPLISKLMWRNIIGQGAAQLSILMPLFFTGQNWFPSEFYHVVNGKQEYWESRHFTFIFNVFVWLQLFNEINSRKVNDEFNIFRGMFDNAWFVSIFFTTCGCQALMVEVFGSFAQTTPQSWDLWLAAIALGATQLVSGFLLRFLQISVTEGQIDLDAGTFENAAWKDDPSLLGAMFKTYRTSDDPNAKAEAAEEMQIVGALDVQEVFRAPASLSSPGRFLIRSESLGRPASLSRAGSAAVSPRAARAPSGAGSGALAAAEASAGAAESKDEVVRSPSAVRIVLATGS